MNPMLPVKEWNVGDRCRFLFYRSPNRKTMIYKSGVIVRRLHNPPYGTVYRQFIVKADDSDREFQIDEPRLLLPDDDEQGER